jgi:release factor glutamine methyltransferase
MATTASSLLAEVPDAPEHVARRLLLAATGADRVSLLSDPQIDDEAEGRFRINVDRWRRGEPLQYIEGNVQFGPITINIDSRALIPRPETEHLWELALGLLEGRSAATIVDLCTGSGNLALALKREMRDARIIGTDISAAAIALARENAADLDLRVDFHQGDLFDPLPAELEGAVDLIVSNPPYVAADDWTDLPAEVRDYEPPGALVAGPAGTEVLARIAAGARRWLRPLGDLICEIGETQGDDCLALFADYDPKILQDLSGRPRYVMGRVPMPAKLH